MKPITEEFIEALQSVLSYLHEDLTEYRLLWTRDENHIGRHLAVLVSFIDERAAEAAASAITN